MTKDPHLAAYEHEFEPVESEFDEGDSWLVRYTAPPDDARPASKAKVAGICCAGFTLIAAAAVLRWAL